MNHYIYPLAPSRYIPIISPSKVTKVLPIGIGIISGEDLIIECAKHGHVGTVVKKPVKKVKVTRGVEGSDFAISTAAHGRKVKKKKKKKSDGLEGVELMLLKPYPGDIKPVDPDWSKPGIIVKIEGWNGRKARETDNGIEGTRNINPGDGG